MKKRKRIFIITLLVATLTMGMNVFAAESNSSQNEIQPRAGCGSWTAWKAAGTAYCTNELCPSGYRKYQPQTRSRTCVRDNNSTYTQTETQHRYVSCGCK